MRRHAVVRRALTVMKVVRTLDFLLRQAMQAVLTQRLLLAATKSFSFLRDLTLVECEGESAELRLL